MVTDAQIRATIKALDAVIDKVYDPQRFWWMVYVKASYEQMQKARGFYRREKHAA